MEVFVARQAIFDRNQNVFGYELLYRKSITNGFEGNDGDLATAEVVTNSFLLIGIESLTGGKKAFINFTRNLLEIDIATLLPNDLLMVEILEDIEPDDKLIEACQRLKDYGYKLVLDDFVYHRKFEPLIKIADYIKIDFLQTDPEQRIALIKELGGTGIKFIAEKIETRKDYELAVMAGYDYFQGYFFSKPVVVSGRDMRTYEVNYFQIINEVNKPEPDFGKIEAIIRKDISLTYKLLKYINSAAYGFKSKITSIKHALIILGTTELKKWINLVALKAISSNKPDEIVRSCLIRARFGELLTCRIGMPQLKSDLFLVGLLSMIDTLTDKPLSDALSQLSLSEEITNALLRKEGTHRDLFDLVLAYERGDWNLFCSLAESFSLSLPEVPKLFITALNWADELTA